MPLPPNPARLSAGLIALAALLGLHACTPRDDDDDPARRGSDTTSWSLTAEPRVRIGVASGNAAQELSKVYGGLVLRDGRIVIGNSATGELRFFDAHGRYLASSGREGSGPGEFRGIHWTAAMRGDSILVYDMRLGRFSVLDSAGRFGRSFTVPASTGPLRPVGVLPGGALVVAAQKPYDPRTTSGAVRDSVILLRMTMAGEVIDTVGRFAGAEWLVYNHPSSYRATRLPFGRFTHLALLGDEVVYASSDGEEARVYDLSGKLVRTIPIPSRDRSLSPAEVKGYLDASVDDPGDRAAIQAYMRRASGMRAPRVEALRTDGAGQLWVRLFPAEGNDSAKWVVLSRGGRLAGSVRMAADDLPLDFAGDFVLLRERDADGVERVSLHGLRR